MRLRESGVKFQISTYLQNNSVGSDDSEHNSVLEFESGVLGVNLGVSGHEASLDLVCVLLSGLEGILGRNVARWRTMDGN